MPSHGTALDVQNYLERYVEHFGFGPRLCLDTTVEQIIREDGGNRWELRIKGSDSRYFDKVVMATGINQRPHIPTLQGLDKFTGDCLHSRAFKRYVCSLSITKFH